MAAPEGGNLQVEDDGADLLIAPRVELIRLRTIVLLRWVAIAGQLCAVVAASALGLQVQQGLILAVIAAAAVMNLAVASRAPRRGSGGESVLQLGFDLAQLTTLLALTGGLSNPFAMLIVVPVTIAATALDRRRVMVLAVATIAMITLAAVLAVPLTRVDGSVVEVPWILELGHWVAIVVAVIFASAYAHRVSGELRATGAALAATQTALAREQKLQHLGGVVAAAAHEMGTPLATIKLVAGELADEIAASSLDHREDIAADIALLRDSADRCRDILRSMGRAGRDDLLVQTAPLSALLAEAAEPHESRGRIERHLESDDGSAEPILRRDAGVVHALRNLIQNAVDFARDRVKIDARWNRQHLRLTISDDGPGYSPTLLSRIGDPFLTGRPANGKARQGYEGMGLGLFIAKTLLERSAAELHFGNAAEGGAVVEIRWARSDIDATSREALGVNPLIEP